MENSVVPQKLKIELPCDQATSRLGIYPEKNVVQQDTHSQCPLQHQLQYPRHGSNLSGPQQSNGSYSATERNSVMPFAATWMDLEMIILSKTEKGKPHMMSLACGP